MTPTHEVSAADADAETEATRLEEMGELDDDVSDEADEGEEDAIEAEEAAESAPVIRSSLKDWTEVIGAHRRKLVKMYPKNIPRLGAFDRSMQNALEAMQTLGLVPESVTEEDRVKLEHELKKKLKAVALYSAVKMGNALISEALGEGIDEATIVPQPPPVKLTPLEKAKAKVEAAQAATVIEKAAKLPDPPKSKPTSSQTDEQEFEMANEPEQQAGEQEEEFVEEEEYQGEEEQAAPPKKSHKRGVSRAQPTMMMMTPQGPMAMAVPPMQQQRAHAYPQARQAPVSQMSKILGVKGAASSSTINLYKRTPTGERVFLRNYALSEIDGSMPKFIREYVDPDEMDPNAQGITTYECVEVDAQGRERGSPALVKISSRTGQTGAPTDPLGQAREALEFVNDLRETEEARRAGQNSDLREAKTNAAKSGDFNGMMMLMMMEKFMGSGGSSDAVVKVLEKIQTRDSGGLGGLPQQPIYIPPQVPAAPSFMEKFMEVQLAKMMEPAKTLVDSLKELEALKSLTGGGNQVADMMKMMFDRLDRIEAKAAPVPAGGLEGLLLGHERLTAVVKTLAPQMNLGGLAGMAQSLFTPKLLNVIGDVAGELLTKVKVPGTPAAKLPAGQVARPAAQAPKPGAVAVAAAPAAQAEPQAQLPQAALEAAQKLRIAQTDEVKIENVLEGLLALWDDPTYKPKLNPALKSLVEGDNLPAQVFIREWYEFSRGEPCPAALSDKAVKVLLAQLNNLPDEIKVNVMASLGVAVAVPLAPPVPPAPVVQLVPNPPPEEVKAAPAAEVVKFPQGKTTPPPTNGATAYSPTPSTGPASNVVQFADPPLKA